MTESEQLVIDEIIDKASEEMKNELFRRLLDDRQNKEYIEFRPRLVGCSIGIASHIGHDNIMQSAMFHDRMEKHQPIIVVADSERTEQMMKNNIHALPFSQRSDFGNFASILVERVQKNVEILYTESKAMSNKVVVTGKEQRRLNRAQARKQNKK